MTRSSFIAVLCVVLCIGSRLPASDRPATTQSARASVADFGAVADGKSIDTVAIQKTIDQIASEGGGTVVIPAGTFLSGAVFLKPGVNLELDKDAVLKGSTDIADYPVTPTRIEGHFQPWIPALVNADHSDHLRITGEGTLDGSGQPFWTEFRTRYRADNKTKNLDVPRPRLMFIQNCDDVQVSGLHLKDSGFWNLHVYHCTNCLISGLNITAGSTSPSTDGMDIDSSQNINIENCYISVNDDCICLKGSKGPFAMDDKQSPPVEHIHVSGCTFGHGGSVVTLGSEATIVRDVVVTHCTIDPTATKGMSMVRLKLRPDTPQNYSDIHFSDITVNGAGQLISVAPWKQYFDLQGQPAPKSSVRNVTVSNITGSCGGFGAIQGNSGDVIDNVLFENIDVKLTNATPKFVGVTNLVVKNVKINGADYAGP